MKYNFINDFAQEVTYCPFCDFKLSLKLKKYSSLYLYNGAFDFLNTELESFCCGTLSYDKKFITSESKLVDNVLQYYKTDLKFKILALSINMDTNNVIGDLHRVQELIYKDRLALSHECNNSFCENSGFKFGYYSSPLVLERINNRIYSFFLDYEVAGITINDSRFILVNTINKPKSYLFDSKQKAIELPKMCVRTMNKDSIIKKIKTIMVFS